MRTSWYRVRLGICFLGVLCAILLILLRLIQLQILPSAQLETLSKRQFRKIVRKTNERKPIFDRNYEELAVSVPAGSIYARPKQVKHRSRVANALFLQLGGSKEKWLKKLSQKKSFIWIQRQVSAEKAKEIFSLKLPGIFVESEPRRLYPNGSLGAHILGFTDVDGKGISGIELKANTNLIDDEDTVLLSKDGKGNATYIEKEESEKEPGVAGLTLTIDRKTQAAVEEELSAALLETGAKSVMAVVMDPHTGEIFAIAQAPTFDPNNTKGSASHLFNNQWVSSLYEPGSTMKPLVAAIALQEGLMKRYSLIDCGQGKLSFGKDTIGEAESDHRFGTITLEKMIHVSSNVGAARLGLLLGADRVRGVFERFGLLNKTGIELPGETTGTLRSNSEWVPILVATSSFGQGVSFTPLQMVAAYAPFANGGFQIKPRLFLNRNTPKTDPSLLRQRILSPKVAETMNQILTGVTTEKHATGLKAAIPGILVAGKTGTAQKYVPGKGYDSKKYFSSFIGYLPADKPQLLIGVMVDEPHFPYYASQVAAPLFSKIAQRSLQLLDKNPKAVLAKAPLISEVPSPELSANQKDSPAKEVIGGEHWVLPELKGLSIKEAYSLLEKNSQGKQIHVKYFGTGFLTKQDPEPGSTVSDKQQVLLYFSPEESL